MVFGGVSLGLGARKHWRAILTGDLYFCSSCHTRFLRPKPDADRMYAQDQVVIHTVRM
jgi:hypothetical protein